MERYNIIIFSNQFFDSPLKTNKWHVATRLAKLGHNVLFIDPPTRFQIIKRLFNGEVSILDLLLPIRRRDENLYVYTPVNFFNFRPLSKLNTSPQVGRIKAALGVLEVRPVIIWVYHFDFPDFEDLISQVKYDLFVYDVVDEYSAFPEYAKTLKLNRGFVGFIEALDDFLKVKLNQHGLSGSGWVKDREEWLLRKADLVFASAPGLVNKFTEMARRLGKDPSLVSYQPNCGDYKRFKDSKKLKDKIPHDMEGIPHPRILFTGAIDSYKLDMSLVKSCAEAYPNFSFVLVGPVNLSDKGIDLAEFKSLNNVYFLGQKNYEETPYYFAGADVFIIPYRLNEYTIAGCFPVKFHDALSAGLPAVVTNLPAYKPFKDVCYLAKSDSEFVGMIKTALQEDSDQRFKERQEVARRNTWDGKVESEVNLIERKLNTRYDS